MRAAGHRSGGPFPFHGGRGRSVGSRNHSVKTVYFHGQPTSLHRGNVFSTPSGGWPFTSASPAA